jgi:tRNA G18 (ribose-2'-O)-methylase SpoU
VSAGGKIALLLGTEGDGLSARWLAAADARVRIPMSAGVGSLNVASAAAIACYLLGRRLP